MYMCYLFILLQGLHISLLYEIHPVNETNLITKTNLLNEISSNLHKDEVCTLNAYLEHIKIKGSHTLKKLGKKLMKRIHAEKVIANEIKAANLNYLKQIQKYNDYITKMYAGRSGRFVGEEEEFMIRNMLETACEYLLHAQQQLLKDVTKKINSTTNTVDKIQQINEIILRQYENEKKEEILYICSECEVCRPYPSFTDYFEGFVIELLKLSDEKLKTFMYLLREIVEANYAFQVLTEVIQDGNMIIYEIENLCINTSIRQSLNIVQTVLNQRFKIFDGSNWQIVIRIQAARTLLDIVDKTFHYSHDLNLKIEYEAAVNAIRKWNRGNGPLPSFVIEVLINNVLNTITLSEKSLKGALIEVIVKGNTYYEGLDEASFTRGWKGVYVNLTTLSASTTEMLSG